MQGLFTESLTHGTMPWRAEHQRRCLLYRYAPAHLALGGSVAEYGEGELEGLSALGRALLEPPGYEPATNSRAGRANIRTLLREQLEA